jgi:hypothetical protein
MHRCPETQLYTLRSLRQSCMTFTDLNAELQGRQPKSPLTGETVRTNEKWPARHWGCVAKLPLTLRLARALGLRLRSSP